MIRQRSAAALAALLVLGGAPVLAEEPENEASMSVTINVEALPLEIGFVDGTPELVFDLVPGQTEGIDFSTTGRELFLNLRTAFDELTRITVSSPGLTEAELEALNDLVVEVGLYFANNASKDRLVAPGNPSTTKGSLQFAFGKTSDAGPRTAPFGTGLLPGYDSITGGDDPVANIEFFMYLDGGEGAAGPLAPGQFVIEYTYIIEIDTAEE
jgi:hypothetical protein